MKRSAQISILTLGITLLALPMFAAGSITPTVPVSATVDTSCTFVSAAMAFGAYDPVGAQASATLDKTGSLVLSCTKNAAVTVTLDDGTALAANKTAGWNRAMSDGGTNFLPYDIFTTSGYAAVWRGATTVGSTGKGPGLANQITIPLYGRIPAAQNVPAATYNDSVVATVNF